MSKAGKLAEWKSNIRAAYDEYGKLAEYSITFLRVREGGEWYDEMRYDSHDRRRGRKVVAPHFHMKIRSAFKVDADTAVEEIRSLIDNYLQRIEEVAGS